MVDETKGENPIPQNKVLGHRPSQMVSINKWMYIHKGWLILQISYENNNWAKNLDVGILSDLKSLTLLKNSQTSHQFHKQKTTKKSFADKKNSCIEHILTI